VSALSSCLRSACDPGTCEVALMCTCRSASGNLFHVVWHQRVRDAVQISSCGKLVSCQSNRITFISCRVLRGRVVCASSVRRCACATRYRMTRCIKVSIVKAKTVTRTTNKRNNQQAKTGGTRARAEASVVRRPKYSCMQITDYSCTEPNRAEVREILGKKLL
jgi:hypothetical protein